MNTQSFQISLAIALLSASTFFSSAHAEGQISVFGGANFSPHSSVDYNLNQGAGNQSITPAWDGLSFEMPPYYGVRGTWWLEDMPNVGLALEFPHAKVSADLPIGGFSTLEFTDGINFFTANALYRWDRLDNGLTPYAGIGAGLAVPKVEVAHPTLAVATDEYQVTGAAVQAMVGLDYKVNETWSVFGELKTSYGQVDADLVGGGTLETNIISNQIILGVTYKFD